MEWKFKEFIKVKMLIVSKVYPQNVNNMYVNMILEWKELLTGP